MIHIGFDFHPQVPNLFLSQEEILMGTINISQRKRNTKLALESLQWLKMFILSDSLQSENTKYLTTHSNPYDAIAGAHALAIITEWDEFKTYDWQKIYDNMSKPAFIFDGRNLLDRSELESIGFLYRGIGQ